MNYSEKLKNCRKEYPFECWLESYQKGIGYYSEEHCARVESIFDGLIQSLINLKEDAEESHKVELFESAVLRLNIMNKTNPHLIETSEREEFCELLDTIALAAGLKPENYAGGEGIATEWREW